MSFHVVWTGGRTPDNGFSFNFLIVPLFRLHSVREDSDSELGRINMWIEFKIYHPGLGIFKTKSLD